MRTLEISVAALVLGAAACGSNVVVTDKGSSPTTDTPATTPAGTIADILQVDDIGVYQAVKASIVKEGSIVVGKPNAPVIANRPAIIRVFVKALGVNRPTIEGELTLKTAGKPDLVLRDGGKKVVTELDDENLGTTLNFSIPADMIQADTSYVFKVAANKLDGATDVMVFPPGGAPQSLGAKTSSQVLKVKFVPIDIDDGTDHPADMRNLQTYKDTLYRMYPVASVDVSVRDEAFKWTTAVQANGDGWDRLLSGLMQLRRADGSPQNVYYVGVFNPKASLEEFCARGGCVLGIAPQAGERDVNMRVALVLGYGNHGAGSTLAQELAHAMGRWHAPCGNPEAIDPDYPYGSASIGVWGYDIIDKKWLDPGTRLKDFMSYCGPTWVSDYTYSGLFDRMDLVQQQMQDLEKAQGTSGGAGAGGSVMQTFFVDKYGGVEQGADVDVVPGADAGQPSIDITYQGAGSTNVGTVKGSVRRISGTGGRIVVAPVAPRAAIRAHLAGIGATALRSSTVAR